MTIVRLAGREWWSVVEAELWTSSRDLLLRLESINLLPELEDVVLAGRDVNGLRVWL